MPGIGRPLRRCRFPGEGASLAGPGPTRLRRPEPAGAVSAHAGDGHSRFRPPGGETTLTASGYTNTSVGRVVTFRSRSEPHALLRPEHIARPSLVAAAPRQHVIEPRLPRIDTFGRPSCAVSVSRVLGRSTLRVLRALRPRCREVTGLRARAACPGTDALPRRQLSLNRRSTWTSIPSSPSGVAGCRRASSPTPSCRRRLGHVAPYVELHITSIMWRNVLCVVARPSLSCSGT